jgi:hypothetical protein
MAPRERLELGTRLAELDLDLRCAAHGTTRDDARRAFRKQRQAGRRPSRVMQDLVE